VKGGGKPSCDLHPGSSFKIASLSSSVLLSAGTLQSSICRLDEPYPAYVRLPRMVRLSGNCADAFGSSWISTRRASDPGRYVGLDSVLPWRRWRGGRGGCRSGGKSSGLVRADRHGAAARVRLAPRTHQGSGVARRLRRRAGRGTQPSCRARSDGVGRARWHWHRFAVTGLRFTEIHRALMGRAASDEEFQIHEPGPNKVRPRAPSG